MAADPVGFGYAALVVVGGIVGYVKAGSVTSLAMGLLFGVLSAVGTRGEIAWLSLGSAGTLTLVMGLRFLSSWKFMPAGLMALASGLMAARIVSGMLRRRHAA